MIAQFPNFYPDELMYSLLARYYVRSGHLAFRYCAEELFKRPTHPDVEYSNDMTEEVKELLGITMIDVISQHTMLPWNARFISRERRQLGMKSLMHGTSDYQNCLYRMRGQANTIRYLRFCPACAAEDRKKFGETYWHRIHQVQGLNICPKHHCFLFASKIRIEGKGSPNLIAADLVMPYSIEKVACPSEIEMRLADYIEEVFNLPMDMKSEESINRFLKYSIAGTEYTTPRGQVVYTAKLFDDLQSYYAGCSENYLDATWKVSKIFSTYINPVAICQLGLFLHIDPKDLVEMYYPESFPYEIYDLKIKEMHAQGYNYREISTAIGGSYDYIKIRGKTTESIAGKRTRSKSGKKARDYKSLDMQYYPIVNELIQGYYSLESKPKRVTVSGISNQLKISVKALEKMPRCMELIENSTEITEAFWIREMVWQYKQLLAEGIQVTISNLAKRPLNLSREDILRTIPYFRDDEYHFAIKEIICNTYL